MRSRLIIVFLVPLTVILLALGGAYGWSVSRSVQQEFSNQQFGDVNYFVTSVRQALRAGNPSMVEGEMERYAELYGAQVAATDRSGMIWVSGGLEGASSGASGGASGGTGNSSEETGDVTETDPADATLDEATLTQMRLALSGRRSDPLLTTFPWASGDAVVVEPVFDDGNVIGAVMIKASVDAPRGQIITHWVLLVGASVVVIGLLLLIVVRLANWVLQPMQRVDDAMAAMERGEMDARISDDTGPPEMQTMIRIFNGMAEEIERAMSRQQEFAANASHELRNPLGALLMRVELLVTGLDEGWEDDIEKVREEGRRMSRILDTLLSLARAGHQDAPFVPVDLAEIAADRAEAWHPVARDRGVSFEIQGETRLMKITDRTSVESALDAVIDNALRFAPRGSVIDLEVTRGDDCRISVRDRGPGVEPEELERMTSRFWRSPRDQNLPGSGLGLAIATDLLTALQGRVEVEAPEGGGLRVSLHFPVEEVAS